MQTLLICICLLAFSCMHPAAVWEVSNEKQPFHSKDQNLTYLPSDRNDYNSPKIASSNTTTEVYVIACHPFNKKSIHCDNGETYLKVGFCLTYEEKTNIISVGLCPYFELHPGINVSKHGSYWYMRLPKDVHKLNDYMCGPLNRKGRLCSECEDGFAPALMSVGFQLQCSNCTGAWYGVPMYLFLELFPVTIFYLVILIFQVNITIAPMTCYIMISQLIVLAWDHIFSGDSDDIHNIMLTSRYSRSYFMKILLTLYDVWNLRFFRYILPSFCVSQRLKPITVAFLDYVSVFYPLTLLFLTWICVHLHDRNFRPLVWLWRPFQRCCIRIRRNTTPTSDLVKVFSSIFLLSFTRMMFQIELLLSYQRVDNYKHNRNYDYLGHDTVVEVDLALPYGSSEHLMYSLPAAFFSAIFNALPILLLLLYPFGIFRGLLSKCRLNGIALHFFVEKFYGCYRNGLDGGKDMRCFAGLYFITRLALFLTNTIAGWLDISSFDSYLSRNFVFSITALMIAFFRPYKESYLNVLDTILLVYMGLFCHLMSSHYGFKKQSDFVLTAKVVMAIPFTGFLLFFVAQALQKIVSTQKIGIFYQKCINSCRNSIATIHQGICARICQRNENDGTISESASTVKIVEISNNYGTFYI